MEPNKNIEKNKMKGEDSDSLFFLVEPNKNIEIEGRGRHQHAHVLLTSTKNIYNPPQLVIQYFFLICM